MPIVRPMSWWSRLPLRLRLTLSFLAVSVPPVLIASFIAAQAISTAFEHNVEQWISEIAQFMANEANEGQEEAQHATAIVAAALTRAGQDTVGAPTPLEPFADLLTSVGYDFVRLYDAKGTVLFARGELELQQPLPLEPLASIFFIRHAAKPAMMVGAVQPVQIGGEDRFLFVANLLDEQFFNAPQTIRSLEVHLFEVVDNGTALADATIGRAGKMHVPSAIFARLRNGADSATLPHLVGNGTAIAYAALRDDRGRLVGIIACRLTGATAAFERLGSWWLFIALAGVAGLLSLLVGISISRRMSEPIKNLTSGVRAVAHGDYAARVPEEGGREIEELAVGFNAMTAQLESLRRMEAVMRHRAQLATLGEASAVIAHEIRNPLGIIKTASELVRRKSPLAPAEDRLIGFVLDEVNRIERLVQELLDYGGPPPCTRAPLDLMREVVQPALDFAAPELKRRGLTLEVQPSAVPVMILGDRDQLHQVLLNLLLNAMDAVGANGLVVVRVVRGETIARIDVVDNGTGIAPDMLDRLFEPFVTSKAKGTGLGLAKVRTTVEAHDGTVECHNGPDRGAIFTIHLPLLKPSEAAGGADNSGR